jgi:hypothetical protein
MGYADIQAAVEVSRIIIKGALIDVCSLISPSIVDTKCTKKKGKGK